MVRELFCTYHGVKRWSFQHQAATMGFVGEGGEKNSKTKVVNSGKEFKQSSWQRLSQEVRWLPKSTGCGADSRGPPHGAQGWLEAPHGHFLGGLTQRAMAGMALRQGGLSVGPRAYLVAWIPYGLMMLSIFLGSTWRAIPFLLTYKKEKGELTIGMSESRDFIKLFFKAPKAMLSWFPKL